MADSFTSRGMWREGDPTQPTFIAPLLADCQGVIDRIMLYQSLTDTICEHCAQSCTLLLEYSLDLRRLPKRLTSEAYSSPHVRSVPAFTAPAAASARVSLYLWPSTMSVTAPQSLTTDPW